MPDRWWKKPTDEQLEAAVADVAKSEPNPGPSIAHAFDCTHDPCRCGGEKEQVARAIGLMLHLTYGRAFVCHPMGGTVVAPYPLPLNFGSPDA